MALVCQFMFQTKKSSPSSDCRVSICGFTKAAVSGDTKYPGLASGDAEKVTRERRSGVSTQTGSSLQTVVCMVMGKVTPSLGQTC